MGADKAGGEAGGVWGGAKAFSRQLRSQQCGVVLGGIGTGGLELWDNGHFRVWQIFNNGTWTGWTGAGFRTSDEHFPAGGLHFALSTHSPDGRGIVASITNLRYWQKAAPMLDAAPALEEVLREHGLVWAIAGRGAFADQFFDELAKRCSPDLWVRAGFVSDPWSLLYAASAFLHISEMDGMPNVVIEAQSCGCPVVASNASSVPEVAGDAAILVDPYNVDAMTAAIQTVLTDRQVRERLVASGFRRADMFSWRRCAETMLNVIRARHARSSSISGGRA